MKKGRSRRPALATALLFTTTALTAPAWAGPPALPQGGAFQAGAGSISANGSTLTVTQTTQRGVVTWNSFSIGAGGRVTVNNGSGATLNRVTGPDLSSILGRLDATGSLYLINPNGVVVGTTGVVVTGGRFVASTADVLNDAFMRGGTLLFKGSSTAEVHNLGAISSTGGDVFRIARSVTNQGSITAPQGSVGLEGGQEILLADGSADPNRPRALVRVAGGPGTVSNQGSIDAAQAELQAAGGNIYALAGNNDGTIRATGSATRDGHVWLIAGAGNVGNGGGITARNADGSGGSVTLRSRSGGEVRTGGAIDVAGMAPGTTGGTVRMLGQQVMVAAGATIDASGAGAGGTVLLGGDFHGGQDPTARLSSGSAADGPAHHG